jgi:hypothetical protein
LGFNFLATDSTSRASAEGSITVSYAQASDRIDINRGNNAQLNQSQFVR